MPGPARSARLLPHVVTAVDFERALSGRSRAVTAHFAVHHVEARPAASPGLRKRPSPGKLSTIEALAKARPVEDSFADALSKASTWIGAVVPKRHARRAVTRSLLKRQIYAAAERQRERLAPGLWIVRLRSPFDRTQFTSAASKALRSAARAELDALLNAASDATPP